jgi:hypothetical protein
MSATKYKYITVCLALLCLVLAGLLLRSALQPYRALWEIDDEEVNRKATIRSCKHMLANPRLAARTRSLAEAALRKWQNNRLDPEPILLYAAIVRPEGKEYPRLLLGISDENGDFAGIRIKEQHLKASGKVELIEEEYPLCGYPRDADTNWILPIEIRTGKQRKNEEAWHNYVEAGHWDKKSRPTIWLSLPKVGETTTQMLVYDHAGHESNPLPLDNRIRVAEMQKTGKEPVVE